MRKQSLTALVLMAVLVSQLAAQALASGDYWQELRTLPFPSMGSLDNLVENEDGSVDLYFGPELPQGAPESNYLRTVPDKGWFTLLRLYSPTQPFFDGSWRPHDFEKLEN